MRRGLGVAHIQQQQQSRQQMADFGAQITAERVSQASEQLEQLEAQLRSMAVKHQKEIKHDPVVRARFRQLADSLGVDLISSKKNVFSGALGLGDFYYRLAGKVVEACMSEKKFCGSYVPVRRVLAIVQRSYDSAVTASDTERTSISEGDIYTALRKLEVLGDGYNVVELGGVKYIQTTPDDAKTSDEIPVLNFALSKQKEQIDAAKKASRSSSSTPASSTAAKPGAAAAAAPKTGYRPGAIGAAYVLGDHPLANQRETEEVTFPAEAQFVSLTQQDLCEGLHWPPHRVRAILVVMVQSGAVWVEYPTLPSTATETKNTKQKAGGAGSGRSLEAVEVWKKNKKSASSGKRGAAAAAGAGTMSSADLADNTIYWFMSLTDHADAGVSL